MLTYNERSWSNQDTPSTFVIAWNIYNLVSRNDFPGIMENVSKYILYCPEK